MNIKLGHVQALWALWGVPLVGLFYVLAARRRDLLLARFAAPEVALRLRMGSSRQRRVIKKSMVLLALTAMILALTEPKWGFTWEESRRQGVDLVVAVDVSDSMLVQDASPTGKLTRLEQAKREITDLLKLVGGDRMALVAFAGVAFVQCPLTIDYSAVAVFLDDMDTDSMPVKGTDVGEAIRTALKALESGPRQSQAVILITDGEDLGGDALAAAEEAQKLGVRIFPVGIGAPEGAPIPAQSGGFRRDSGGNLVLSRLDEASLQKIAYTTGGRYVRARGGEMGLEDLYTQGIRAQLQDQTSQGKRRQRWHERFQWLLLVSVVLLAAEALIPERVEARHV